MEVLLAFEGQAKVPEEGSDQASVHRRRVRQAQLQGSLYILQFKLELEGWLG